MKRREIIEIGLITAGMLVGAVGLFAGGTIFGRKLGADEGEKTGFEKGATAQYHHMTKKDPKTPIGFNPSKPEEDESDDD